MGKKKDFVSQFSVGVGGEDLSLPVTQKLLQVVVDQHCSLPDIFTLRLHDSDLELLDNGPFDLTKKVEVTAATKSAEKVVLMKGEITSLEPRFGDGMIAELVVRGYDLSHRLYREMKSKAHLNKKDSDLASEIAQAAGLKAEVDPTKTVYDHIYQHNQSDLSFLMQRAWRIGYECYVEDDTLYFRKPPTGEANVTLTWGDDLLSFRPRMTLAEQVDEVVVKGWDIEKKAAIVGRAQNGRLYPKIGEAKDGAKWGQDFSNGKKMVAKKVIVDQPVVNQADADLLAAARLDEISGAFIQAEGLAYRRPEIKAGRFVKLEGLGKRLSGTYLVTRASHVYSAEGMFTTFWVTGSRTGLLAETLSSATPSDRWPGVVTALVTNADDPKGWGRVKVKYPWMAEDAESDWARVLGIGGGPQAGLFVLPAVGDEVLVIFAHGDFSQPYVLGGVWNGVDRPPPEVAKAKRGEKPLVRTWHSRSGHWIAMFDDANKKVEIVTAAGHMLSLDDKSGKITITSTKDMELIAKTDLKIQAGGNLEIQANGKVDITGATVNLN